MMIVNRRTQKLIHGRFQDLPELLGPGDVLVVNDSKVLPARLTGRKETGGTAEILLLEKRKTVSPSCEVWETIVKRGKRIRTGMRVQFGDAGEAVVGERLTEKKWLITFTARESFSWFLETIGRPPLPPYIKRDIDPDDATMYQTVYARWPGSIAAPTAGLHFTEESLSRIEDTGAAIASVTLHVGYGTFSPITSPVVEDHVMDEEYYEIGADASSRINGAGRVIAVGTTSTRVLESTSDENGKVSPTSARTRLFIYPGYRFRRVDALLTNFHLPRSSLYLLVCAFAGKELMEKAYAEAVARAYRFYSYGDCMLIL